MKTKLDLKTIQNIINENSNSSFGLNLIANWDSLDFVFLRLLVGLCHIDDLVVVALLLLREASSEVVERSARKKFVLNGLNLRAGYAVNACQEVLADLDFLSSHVHIIVPTDSLVVSDRVLNGSLRVFGTHQSG